MSCGPLRNVINFCTGDLPTAKSATRKQWGMCLHRFTDPQLGHKKCNNSECTGFQLMMTAVTDTDSHKIIFKSKLIIIVPG
jgi:hypothetical protein